MIFRITFEPEAGQADRQNPAGSCSMVACTFTLQAFKRPHADGRRPVSSLTGIHP